MNKIDPATLFAELSANARPQKRANLEIIHKVCQELSRLGSTDFSLATIGRMSEERDGISRRALYNSTSEDFKRLIQAWANVTEARQNTAPKRKSVEAHSESNEFLRKIADPALRSLIAMVIAERDTLLGEVKLLRANANIVVDRRTLPGHVNVTPSGQVIQVMSSAGLSNTEKQALEQAISSQFFKHESWSEGPNGEILNSTGRKLFDIGFTNAIRKVLAS